MHAGDELPTKSEGDAIDDSMAEQMELRRQARPDRRRRTESRTLERRRICDYCFQPGDHRTAADCRRALDRG